MLVFGGPVFHKVLLELLRRVWSKVQVFATWDVLVDPMLKKGNLIIGEALVN